MLKAAITLRGKIQKTVTGTEGSLVFWAICSLEVFCPFPKIALGAENLGRNYIG